MVILRYFSREILTTATAVSVVLLLVVLSGRFIQFLERAANGELSVELMLTMIVWRIPSSLELILPLALTLSVLLVMSRLNQDSELAVLRAAGYSNRRLFGLVTLPAVVVACLVGWLSLVLSPEVARELDRQVDARERLTVFDTVVPGRFQTGKSGRLIYAESISEDRQSLLDVFIVEPSKERNTDVFLTGKTARQEFTEGDKFLVVFDGYKHVGSPNQLNWEISRFDRYLIRLSPDATERPSSLDTLSTEALIASGGRQELAIASWRVSLPMMCLLMLPFAFLLGRGSPRQSRFLWVIPVILFQFFYMTALSFAQKAVMRGEIPPWPGVFLVHLVVLGLIVVILFVGPWVKRRGWA